MRYICSIMLAACLATNTLFAADVPPVNLMPEVSEVQWGESAAVHGAAAIVLSETANRCERTAARLLTQFIEKRFGQQWLTYTDKDVPSDARLRVFLGQRKSFPALDQLCNAQKISVPAHNDGYALKVWSQGGTITAVVAGTNDRGVIYGQDTLFQLFKGNSDVMTVQAATIRDWPTIPLRGRPYPHYQHFLKPGIMDGVITSRFNFIDLRGGVYAFMPGEKLDRDALSKIISDARDHGLRVYAAVNTGVSLAQQDTVMETFKELVELGCDGLWASFDDKGAGEAPRKMVERIIALGKKHGITGDAIATTPPKGDYQVIKTKFNMEVAAVPGMEQAVWYWTSIPCAADAADGAEIGLRVNPSWWHNWPRFLSSSLHSGGSQGYMPVISLAWGWNRPNDKELTEMGSYVHSIMLWDGWPLRQDAHIPVLGWWSWRPEKHDFQAVRRRIYDRVYGPELVKTAMTHDDITYRLRDRFQYWSTHTDFAPKCPPRLLSLKDRGQALADLDALQGMLAKLRKSAKSTTLIDENLLEQQYLEPMAREIKTGRALTKTPYPEYWYPEHQSKVLQAIYDGDIAKAERLNAGVRDRILDEVAQVEEMIDTPNMTGRYAKWWRKRANATPADFQKLIAKRKAALMERVAIYNKTRVPFNRMLAGWEDPPIQVGTGPWERHNHLLATVLPEPRETYWGDWVGGIVEKEGLRVACFALEKHDPVNANTFVELPVNIPISGQRDRLALLVYLADANKEKFGLGYAKWRWSGYRTIFLKSGEQDLWQADLGIPRIEGEWFVVPLPDLPADLETLPLRLRIEDYFPAKNNLEIVYVGPIHLIELDRD